MSPLIVTAGSTLSPPLQVLVTDAYGNPVSGASVFFTAPSSGPTGSFVGGDLATTNAQGVASATFTADTKAGSYGVSVYALGAKLITFSVTNTPDVASRVLLSVPAYAIKGTPFTFTVSALDQYGNIATGYRGTVSLSSSDDKARLPANYTFLAADNGVHAFQATFNTMGSQTLTVSDTVTFSLTSMVTLSVSGKSNTAPLIANQSTSSIRPGARLGALQAQARGRGGRHSVASRHRAINPYSHRHSDRVSSGSDGSKRESHRAEKYP